MNNEPKKHPWQKLLDNPWLLLVLGALLAWFLVESAAGWGFYEG
jgi:hypothetical protein